MELRSIGMITNLPSPLYKIEPSFIVAALTQNYNRQTARPEQEFVHTEGREILRDTTFAKNGTGAPVCAKERQVASLKMDMQHPPS